MSSYLIAIIFCLAGINCAPSAYNNPMHGHFIGGDMLFFESSKGVAQLENYRYRKWTDGVIPYTIDSGFSTSQLSTITGAMRKIEQQVGASCIRFVQRTNQANYINIVSNQQGCFSYVGMNNQAGPQTLSLARSGCVYTGIAIHELLHAVGFHHEQNRPDRDTYLTINYQNIKPNMAYNFDKLTNVDTQGFAYDYFSIMHYESNAFSANGLDTMVPKQPGVTLLPAYRKYSMTNTDIAEVRKWYGCMA